MEKGNKAIRLLKKIFHILKYIFLFLVVSLFLIIGAINLPFVHRALTSKVNNILHEKGLPVHVGNISILLSGEIGLSKVEIITKAKDTIVYAGNIRVSVRPGQLFYKKVVIQNVLLQDVVANLITDKNSGELNLIALFSSLSPKLPVKEAKEQKASKPWDISVNEVHLQNIRFLYSDSLHGLVIRQDLQKADLLVDEFSLLRKRIDLGFVTIEKLKGLVAISEGEKDTIQTVSAPSPWKFSGRSLQLKDILFTLDQPDSRQRMDISLTQGDFSVKTVDLAAKKIVVSQLKLLDPAIQFVSSAISPDKNPETEPPQGSAAISFPWSIECKLFDIRNGSFFLDNQQDKSGNALQHWMPVEAVNTTLTDIKLSPAGSGFNMSNLAFAIKNKAIVQSGKLLFEADSLMNGKLFLELAAALELKNQSRFERNDAIRVSAAFEGSMDRLQIGKFDLHTPTGNDISITGLLTNLMNMPESGCDLKLSSKTISREQTKELVALFGNNLDLPAFRPFTLSGRIGNSILNPEFDLDIMSESGNIGLSGKVDLKKNTGTVDAIISELRLGELVGNADIDRLTGSVALNADWSNLKKLAGEGKIEIDSIRYKNVTTTNLGADLSVKDNQCLFSLNASDTALACALNGMFDWNNGSYKGRLHGNFDVDAGRLNLYPRQLSAKGEITASFSKTSDSLGSSANLQNLTISNGIETKTLKNTSLVLNMADSLFQTRLESDFLSADFYSQSSLASLKRAVDSSHFQAMFSLDSSRFINLHEFSQLPGFKLNMNAQYDSLISLFIPDSVFKFNHVHLQVDKKSRDSLAYAELTTDSLRYTRFRTFGANMRLNIEKDKLNGIIGLDSLDVANMPIGASSLAVDILPGRMLGKLLVADRKGSPVYKLGAEVLKEKDWVLFRSTMPEWILNANTWTLSPSEFLNWETRTRDLVANVHLHHDEMKIDLTGRKSQQLNLDIDSVLISMLITPELISSLPDGILSAGVTFSDNAQKNMNFNLAIAQLKWQNLLIDRLSASGKIIADTSGILESGLTAQLNDSAIVNITYGVKGNSGDRLLHSTFSNLPIPILEPLVSEFANRLQGTASGEISLGYENNKPRMDGEIRFRETALNIIPLNSWYTIPDASIEIKKNQLYFNKFMVLDTMQKRLYVNGTINLDADKMTTDLKVTLDNLQVMNTTVKDNPVFFGAIVVNSGLDITGALKSPTIKGHVALENGTNITYRQAQDISVNETQKTVTFARLEGNRLLVSDSSSKLRKLTRMPSIQTTIEINPKSIFNVEVSSIYNIAIRISGAGFLDYNMLPNNTISLTGSYEIQNGTADLKFTGWPKKYFTITPGSSLQWNGSVDNPELNLEATSKVKGSYVNPVDNKTRNVDFIVSMKLANQLSQLSVVFDVKSPDQYISSVLNALPPDEVMRQAVNLLLFESIQLPGIESSSNYLAAQMNSFWESQLNAMTKTSLKNFNLSFGIDTYTQATASGGQQDKTSFTYEMERKLWKDRASVKVSGRLNDDTHSGETSNAVIENFTFEYSIDTLGIKFLKLYRHQDYEDILEGEVIKSGVGFIYRKSYPELKDIWKREEKKKEGPQKPINGNTK